MLHIPINGKNEIAFKQHQPHITIICLAQERGQSF